MTVELGRPGGAAARTQLAGEEREKAVDTRAGDLPAPVGHLRQKGQFRVHALRLDPRSV